MPAAVGLAGNAKLTVALVLAAVLEAQNENRCRR